MIKLFHLLHISFNWIKRGYDDSFSLMNSWIEFAVTIQLVCYNQLWYKNLSNYSKISRWQKFSELCKTVCCTDLNDRLIGKYGSLISSFYVLRRIPKCTRMIAMALPISCSLRFEIQIPIHSIAMLLSTYFTVYANAAKPIITTRLASALCNGLCSLCNWSRIKEETSDAVDWCLACFSSSFRRSSSVLIACNNIICYLTSNKNILISVMTYWYNSLCTHFTVYNKIPQQFLERAHKTSYPANCILNSVQLAVSSHNLLY